MVESFEFYLRTRKRVLSSLKKAQPTPATPMHVYDLACGHGLVSLLYVACNPHLPLRANLLDSRLPQSHDCILKVRFKT